MFVLSNFGMVEGLQNQKPSVTIQRPWTHQINGVASARVNGRLHWFVTTETGLHRFTDSEETGAWIESAPNLEWKQAMPGLFERQRFDHLGDCDFDEETGLLWVAVEGGGPPAFFAFDADLRYRRHASIDQKFASWCAVKGGLVYSSEFGADVVYGYDVMGIQAVAIHEICLPHRLERIQGGSFDKAGRLVLSVDDDKDPHILVVNVDGSIHQKIVVDRRAFGAVEDIVNAIAGEAVTRDKEMQGIDARGGALHLLVSDKNWLGNDGLIFLHYDEVEETFEVVEDLDVT